MVGITSTTTISNMNNLSILRALYALSITIEATYEIGHESGRFYRTHLHKYVVQFIAFTIAAIIHLWVNRESIRNTVGSWFVYTYEPDVPVVVTPPVEPFVYPLYEQLDELLSLSARNLRQVTGINRKCSKYLLASHYLSFA